MYFIYGDESFLIEEKVKQIINENNSYRLVELNAETKMKDLVNEIMNFSIFDQEKIVVIKNLYLFNKNQEEEIKFLINSINLKPETTKIIFVYESLIDKQKNILINYLLNNAQSFEFKQLNERQLSDFVRKKIKLMGGIINDVNLFYFLSKVPNKLIIIHNELEKLISFDKNITKSNIDDLIPKYELSKAFEFINAFNEQNAEEVFKIYYEKIERGESIVNLINQITNVLDLCSQIHSYKQLNWSDDEIAQKTQKHIFIIKKNKNLLNLIGYNKIIEYLKKLSQLDTDIKMSRIDEKIGFEQFLLNIFN